MSSSGIGRTIDKAEQGEPVLPSLTTLKRNLSREIEEKSAQGYDTAVLGDTASLPDSYDELHELSLRLRELPLRDDWPYIEPSDIDSIEAEAEGVPEDITGSAADSRERARAAFLGSVAGCMLGKPVEVETDHSGLEQALESAGEWPLRYYVTESALEHLGARHESWAETVRENISFVAPDDDINYSILGMLVLEQHGTEFTRTDLAELWVRNLSPRWTFGPERAFLAKACAENTGWPEPEWDLSDDQIDRWVTTSQFGVELCGAAIRADAYGYAAMGNPTLAAHLAHRDGSMTHRKNGIYGAMFNAAAIASASLVSDPLDAFRLALKTVPRNSRFYEIVADCLDIVNSSSSFDSAYDHIHERYKEHGFCQLYQEAGTMINSAKFSESTGEGICLQVSQGNDTDSYGATLGSILGAFYGPEGLEEKWLAPFNNEIRTTLASFYERQLDVVAERMGRLPEVGSTGGLVL